MTRFSPAARNPKTIIHGLGAVVAILALSGCVQDATPTPNPTPSLPSDAPRALVIGAVGSPIYDGLKKSVRMVSYDGSQTVADYDLVIFDGDAQTPETVRDNELIRVALRSHKWVLGVDITTEHKRTGLGDYLLAATKGASPGYLARITREPNGHTGTQILEFPSAPTPFGDIAVAVQTQGAPRGVTAEGAAQFVRNALRELRGGRFRPLQTNPGSSVPPYVSYYPFYFEQTLPWTAQGAKKANKNGMQSVYYQLNYAFEVFLDNATNPSGDFQWVSVLIDGEANPTNGTGSFVNRAKDEQAWFQDQFRFNVTPSDADSSQFASFGSSPETLNGQTTVSSGVNFTVGLNSDGPSGSFGYSYSQERTITDWKITDDSSANLMSWNYRSNTPYDADGTYKCGTLQNGLTYNGFSKDCYPETPADLSLDTLSTHAQGVWNTQTSGVVLGLVDFDVHSEQHLADAYCSDDLGLICTLANDASQSRGYVYADNTLSINMSAVIPVAVQSVTFSENPATAGDTVTGTITLASAVQRDTQLQLSSNSENATVLPKVTVPQGQTSANFQVLTNANGLISGGNTVATITAFYAGNFQAQLTVKNP